MLLPLKARQLVKTGVKTGGRIAARMVRMGERLGEMAARTGRLGEKTVVTPIWTRW
jgi:energy-converting hydrogenase Eha subunit B